MRNPPPSWQARLLAVLCLCGIRAAMAAPFTVESALANLPIHTSGDQNVFATPFDYRNGMLFTVHVEAGDGTGRDGVNLHTVVRKGVRQPNATWVWEKQVIEKRTSLDTWHTQASISLDKEGYIHVAYNMHNFPWQYAVSTKPYDISSFTFKGQQITQQEIDLAHFDNKTNFPDIGSAAIPGNQITYPIFTKDRNDDLYVTYRFAVRPNRLFDERAFGAGIARYDVKSRTWHSIGGNVVLNAPDASPYVMGLTVQKPFAFEDGYTVYLPTIGFDSTNAMHVVWNWRLGTAGTETIRPSYSMVDCDNNIVDPSGTRLTLPINLSHSFPITGVKDNEEFYAPKVLAFTRQDAPMVLMQPLLTPGRQIWKLNKVTAAFEKEESPWAASALVVDKKGRQWAFATGLHVFMRADGASRWDDMGEIGTNLCAPKVTYYPAEDRFAVHAKSCSGDQAYIFTFRR